MMSESPKTINRTEYYMKDTTRSGISALLTTGISLAANYGFNLSPDTIRLLASFTPVINQCVNRVLGIFEHRSLARIECARLDICYTQMASTIERNHNNGRGIVFPDLMAPDNSQLKIDEIFEAIFKASIDDSQTVKSIIYGRLMGNIPFQSRHDASASYLLLKTAMQLTFDELCLLAVMANLPEKNYYGIEQEAGKDNSDASELFAYMLHINSLGLLKRIPFYTLGKTIENHSLSSLGHDLCLMLELELLPIDNVNAMSRRLNAYLSEAWNPSKKSKI